MRRLRQIGPFRVCWESFIPDMRREGACWESFVPEVGPCSSCRESFVPHMRRGWVCGESFVPEVGPCGSCWESFVPKGAGEVVVGRIVSCPGVGLVPVGGLWQCPAAHGRRGRPLPRSLCWGCGVGRVLSRQPAVWCPPAPSMTVVMGGLRHAKPSYGVSPACRSLGWRNSPVLWPPRQILGPFGSSP